MYMSQKHIDTCHNHSQLDLVCPLNRCLILKRSVYFVYHITLLRLKVPQFAALQVKDACYIANFTLWSSTESQLPDTGSLTIKRVFDDGAYPGKPTSCIDI